MVTHRSDLSMSSLSPDNRAESAPERGEPPPKLRGCLSICGFMSFSRSHEDDTRTLHETTNCSLFNIVNDSHRSNSIEVRSYESVCLPSLSNLASVPSELTNNLGALKWGIGKMKNQSWFSRIEVPPLPPYHDLPDIAPNIQWIQGLPSMLLNISDKYVRLTTDILRGTGLSRGECESTVFQREISLDQVEFICELVIAKEYKGWICEYPDGTESITTFYVCAWLAYTMNWHVTWIHIDMEGRRVGNHCQCVLIKGRTKRTILEGSISSIVKHLYLVMSDDKDRILIIDGNPRNRDVDPLYNWSRHWHERDKTRRRLIHLEDVRLSYGRCPVQDDLNRIKVFRTSYPDDRF